MKPHQPRAPPRPKHSIACQHGQYELRLPCNWVQRGVCAVNGKKCDIRILES